MVKTRDEVAPTDHELGRERKQTFGLGLLKGLGVTLKHLFKRNTVIQYPDEKQDLAPRTRGVIALKEENCTVCMLCARECPDWCIYIDSHKETLPPKREGGRPRKRNVLDRFAIDYALCMYCGICVEVCPYDALFWSREFEYAEYDIRELTHEKERLSDWMATVLPPPPLEEGAEIAGQPAAAVTPTVEATGARAATVSSSAADARTEQAKIAPKAGTAAPTDARPTESLPAAEQAAETEAVPEPQPAAEASSDAPADGSRSSEAAPQADTPPAEASPSAVSSSSATEIATPDQASRTEPLAPAEASPDTLQSSLQAPPTEPQAPPTEPQEPREDPQAVYERVLQEQRDKGSSPPVAEARAKVARVKAERGVRTQPAPAPAPAPEPSAPTQGRATEPEPSGAPEAAAPTPEPGPVAPTAEEKSAPPVSPSSASETTARDQAPSGEPQEDPEAVYERVLAEERAKGSSDAVAVARAKAARVRAQKGTQGPGGKS